MTHLSDRGDGSTSRERVALPPPVLAGTVSVERALAERRSLRHLSPDPLTPAQLAQLLWAAQGVSEPARAFRTAPSAGATFPLETLAVVGNVEGLPAGVYRYLSDLHVLSRVRQGDVRESLRRDGLSQPVLAQAAVVVAFSAVFERTALRYGDRAARYVHMEAGHAAQNLCLQAVALGLASVCVGAFDDGRIKAVLGCADDEEPLYMVPIGYPG